MKKKLALLAATLAVMTAGVPTIAHHSFAAEFDSAKPIKLTGAVTKVEWMNPHAYFYIDAAELCEAPPAATGQTPAWKCGKVEKTPNWGLEMGSPNGLMRQGWSRNTMKAGDVITVEGSRAKDGSQIANARAVVTADGKRLFAASSQGNAPTP